MSIDEVHAAQARCSRLGNIVGWLQSIEFMLRWWLTKCAGQEIILPTYVGQVMEKSPVNDYRSLRQLLTAYNAQLSPDEAQFVLDPGIVEIRDAHAHGRVLAVGEERDLTLYRFSEPANGTVTVIAMRPLSDEVLEAEIDLMRRQFDLVYGCGTARGYFN